MELYHYMARVERAVRGSIGPDAHVLCIIEHDTSNNQPEYWEREYYVAWSTDMSAGTHRVHIDSTGKSALFMGHYDMTETDAKHDAVERAGLSVGRI